MDALIKCYIVAYDLVSERDYDSLYEAIQSYSKWARITDSTWVIVTKRSAVEIRDHLLTVMDGDDRLFVVKSGVEGAWSNVVCRNKWLKDNL